MCPSPKPLYVVCASLVPRSLQISCTHPAVTVTLCTLVTHTTHHFVTLTLGLHATPKHSLCMFPKPSLSPHAPPSHSILTPLPHTIPKHPSLTPHPHTPPSHPSPHTPPSHPTLTPHPHTPPSHLTFLVLSHTLICRLMRHTALALLHPTKVTYFKTRSCQWPRRHTLRSVPVQCLACTLGEIWARLGRRNG